MKYEKNDETPPKYVGYVEDILHKWKLQKESESQKSTLNRLIYDKLSMNLEPNLNDAQ
jgi:hypothetical protein